MIHLESDYNHGACPEILDALTKVNANAYPGYGLDEVCESAKAKIRSACDAPEAEVFFLSGGTQTNMIVIRSLLRLYEGVLSCDTGHVSVHEAGAIEATGHKVLPVSHVNGKMTADNLNAWLENFKNDGNHDHMVHPGMVYISHPTEYGTLYAKAELEALSAICAEHDLPLYVDGARLAYALACEESDVTLKDLARLCDAFYIGGTKCGAYLGEALVFPKGAPQGFFTMVKQMGGLMAKGWLMGVQFDTLFTDDLYMKAATHALTHVKALRNGLVQRGITLQVNSPTNQVFPVFDNDTVKALSEKVSMGFWEEADESHTVMRLATSWATTGEDIKGFFAALDACMNTK